MRCYPPLYRPVITHPLAACFERDRVIVNLTRRDSKLQSGGNRVENLFSSRKRSSRYSQMEATPHKLRCQRARRSRIVRGLRYCNRPTRPPLLCLGWPWLPILGKHTCSSSGMHHDRYYASTRSVSALASGAHTDVRSFDSRLYGPRHTTRCNHPHFLVERIQCELIF